MRIKEESDSVELLVFCSADQANLLALLWIMNQQLPTNVQKLWVYTVTTQSEATLDLERLLPFLDNKGRLHILKPDCDVHALNLPCLILPQDFQWVDQTLDIILDSTLEDFFNAFLDAGGEWLEDLNESFLLDVQGLLPHYSNFNASVGAFFEYFLPMLTAREVQPTEEFYYFYLDLLVRYQGRFSIVEFQDILITVITTLFEQSENLMARLLLMLCGRQYAKELDGSAPLWFDSLKNTAEVFITAWVDILPPVQNLTVGILIPTYNRLTLLKQTVHSVLSQSSSSWCCYISDDCSSDGTEAYCRALVAQYPEKIFYSRNEKNLGHAATIQNLIRHAETELIVMSTDDQLLNEHFVARAQQAYQKYPWVAYVAGSLEIRNVDTGHVLQHGPYYDGLSLADHRLELQRSGLISPNGPACIYRKAPLKEIGHHDIWLCPQGDGYAVWDYLTNAKLMARFDVAYIPDTLMVMLDSLNTASRQTDHTYEMLYLYKELVQDYNHLFGVGSFPKEISHRFMLISQQTILNYFNQALSSSSSAADLEHEIKHLQRGWHAFVDMQGWLSQGNQSDQSPLLVDVNNPYR